MGGGLIQLASYSTEDLYLTKDPQITFFKIVYRRYTNFSSEVVPQIFADNPDFAKRVTCTLSRNGDLIRKMHLVVVLPNIPHFKDETGCPDVITKFAWVRRVGYAIIRSVEIEIGNELIDKQYGDWLNIWHELTIQKKKDLSKMLGDVRELTDFTNGKQNYKLFIPLRFWFNRFTGSALPMISLQYNTVKINLELRPLEEVSIVTPSHFINIENDLVNFEEFEFIEQCVDGVVSLGRFMHFDIIHKRLYFWKLTDCGFLSPAGGATEGAGCRYGNKFAIRGLTSRFEAVPQPCAAERVHKNKSVNLKNIVINKAFLLVEYIFLDTEERVRFYKSKHEYLIEQIQFNGEKVIDTHDQSFKVNFSHMCKELQWVTQLGAAKSTRVNDHFNYTDSLLKDECNEPVGGNIIRSETILFNGLERLSLRDSSYFTLVQPYQHHSNGPRSWINVYSFSIHPEKHQPTGAANMSRIDNISLRTINCPYINFVNSGRIRIYGVIENILRVANGICGLVFANDRVN